MMPQLVVDNLEFRSQSRVLLSNISFSVEPGELIGIIGPNGAGKSTLLKCLCGFNSPSAGAITINGQPMSAYSHQQRAQAVSYLPQHTEPAFAFLVEDVIHYGRFSHDKKSESAELQQFKIDQIIDQLEIRPLLKRPLNQLSGGEQQRVHFARLLVQDADLMLLDEPSSSLDIGHEAQLMNCIYHACKRGKTALVAIHNLNTALEFCDRLLLLDKGKMIAFDDPNQVLTPNRIEMLYQDNVTVSQNPKNNNLYLIPRRKPLP